MQIVNLERIVKEGFFDFSDLEGYLSKNFVIIRKHLQLAQERALDLDVLKQKVRFFEPFLSKSIDLQSFKEPIITLENAMLEMRQKISKLEIQSEQLRSGFISCSDRINCHDERLNEIQRKYRQAIEQLQVQTEANKESTLRVEQEVKVLRQDKSVEVLGFRLDGVEQGWDNILKQLGRLDDQQKSSQAKVNAMELQLQNISSLESKLIQLQKLRQLPQEFIVSQQQQETRWKQHHDTLLKIITSQQSGPVQQAEVVAVEAKVQKLQLKTIERTIEKTIEKTIQNQFNDSQLWKAIHALEVKSEKNYSQVSGRLEAVRTDLRRVQLKLPPLNQKLEEHQTKLSKVFSAVHSVSQQLSQQKLSWKMFQRDLSTLRKRFNELARIKENSIAQQFRQDLQQMKRELTKLRAAYNQLNTKTSKATQFSQSYFTDINRRLTKAQKEIESIRQYVQFKNYRIEVNARLTGIDKELMSIWHKLKEVRLNGQINSKEMNIVVDKLSSMMEDHSKLEKNLLSEIQEFISKNDFLLFEELMVKRIDEIVGQILDKMAAKLETKQALVFLEERINLLVSSFNKLFEPSRESSRLVFSKKEESSMMTGKEGRPKDENRIRRNNSFKVWGSLDPVKEKRLDQDK